MDESVLRIGNAQAFWGDRTDAAAELAEQAPKLDVMTLDYLAEVSMSIMAIQRDRDPTAGYARDFLEVVRSLTPHWRRGSRLKLITNAGGLNPAACARACVDLLQGEGCAGVKVGLVVGDDVLDALRTDSGNGFDNLESGEPLALVQDRLVTANAYIGASTVVEALRRGATIVVTGRVADPSLVAAPCIHHFGWDAADYSRIAGATIAGHLIECGTQVTGGIANHWLELPETDSIGFPVVEVAADGSCIVTKAPKTGGEVSERTVKEQLLYEIGDPACYLSPDATVSFLGLSVRQEGADRVRVTGAAGSAPPLKYKVSATYRAGFRAMGTLTVVGRNAAAKARRCGENLLLRLKKAGASPARSLIECLGTGDSVGRVLGGPPADSLMEVVLRICVEDPRKEVVERFSRELAPMVTSGPPGTTGYADGRPSVRPVFGYWPCLIDRGRVFPNVTVFDAS